MTLSARLFLCTAGALLLSAQAFGQAGGGGLGAASLGLRVTGATRGIEATPIEQAIPGRWRIEFRIRRHTEDPEASGTWRTVVAEMFLSGMWVTGSIRDDEFPGDFTCSIDDYGRCIDGRLRFHEDSYNWQEFSFIIDRTGDRAEGWAVFHDRETGALREYELQMRKR